MRCPDTAYYFSVLLSCFHLVTTTINLYVLLRNKFSKIHTEQTLCRAGFTPGCSGALPR